MIRRFPVTNREYIAFLTDLVTQGHADEALRWVPRERAGTQGGHGDPIYGLVIRPGDPVDFTAEVGDDELPVEMLDVSWKSDRDGPLGTSIPSAAGAVTLPDIELSEGAHVVTLSVSDVLELTCSDEVSLLVDAAGTSLSFDGGDIVTIEGSAEQDLSEGFTLEAWVLTTATSGEEPFLLSKHSRGYYNGWFLSLNYSGFEPAYAAVFYVDGLRISGGDSLNDGAWHHLAGTWSSDATATLYVDGVLVATDTMPYDTESPARITLGQTDGSSCGECLNGLLDEVSIWGVARTDDEVAGDASAPLVGDEDGLLMYWTFDDGSGQTLTDRTGNGWDGVLGTSAASEGVDPAWNDDEPF